MTPLQGKRLLDYRNHVPFFQPQQTERVEYGFISSMAAIAEPTTLVPPPPLLYNPLMSLPVPSLQSSLREHASHMLLLSILPGCLLFNSLIMGANKQALAQMPGRAATPAGPVGASMAVLAMLQDADVLPPEGTSEANRVIKVVIQFQSVLIKSHDPAVQEFLSDALAAQGGSPANERLLQFRSSGWTSEVLEALNEEWEKTASEQRARLEPGFRQFNVNLADFDRLMGLVAQARKAFVQQGRNIHRVFAQRRQEMPGGAP